MKGRARFESLMWHACSGGIEGAEAEEFKDLYYEMRDNEAHRRRKAVQKDRERVADLVRAFLSPGPGSELTEEAQRLLDAIMSGARVKR